MVLRIFVICFGLGMAIHVRRPRRKPFADILFDLGPEEWAPTRDELTKKIDEEIRSGFPLVERSPEPLQSRVVGVRARGSMDPCEADFLMDGFTVPYGFGARAMAIVDELQVAALLNKSVSICDGNSHEEGVGWSRYFVNPGFGVCNDLEVCYAKKNAAGWLGAQMSVKLREQNPNNAVPLRDMKHFLYNQFFIFNSQTRGVVSKALQDAGLAGGVRYVGVHIRRGDKKRTRHLPIALWANAVAEELKKRSLSTVFVASDDENAGDELAQELTATKYGLQPLPTIMQIYSNSSSSRTYSDSAGDLALLIDVAALRDSEVYIGSHFSYIGRLAYFLRDPKANSRSVSGDWLGGRLL